MEAGKCKGINRLAGGSMERRQPAAMAPGPGDSPQGPYNAPMSQLLLHNGRFLTGDLAGTTASWMSIEAGRIVAIGTGTPQAAAKENSIDLLGRTVTPGFYDAHVHLTWIALAMLGPDLSATTDVAELQDAVRAWEAPGRGPDRAWIVGDGFDETTWHSRQLPTRSELDALGGTRPIVVKRVCGHVGVGNSIALQELPDGAHTNRQTGRIAEDDLWALNDRLRPDADAFYEIWPLVQERLHANGITSVHDVASLQMIEALRRREAEDDLQVRVTFSVPAANRAALHGWQRASAAQQRLRFLGLKVFTDGSLGAHTAHLRQAYADAPDTCGTSLYETSALRQVFRDAHAQGWQLMVHAIGDAALDEVLVELQPFCEQGNPLQHRLEHLEVTPEDVIVRLANSGAWACVQPNFARRWSTPGGMNEQRLGVARLQHCNVYRNLQEAGVPLAFGSDCMPLGPLYGLQAAVHHPLPHQRLPPEQALHYYAATPAALCFDEEGAGILRPGQRADLAVLSGELFAAEASARVEATMADGNWVWQRGPTTLD